MRLFESKAFCFLSVSILKITKNTVDLEVVTNLHGLSCRIGSPPEKSLVGVEQASFQKKSVFVSVSG